MKAVHLSNDEAIKLDGKLNELIWSTALPATDFVQRIPDVGTTATQKTEARVIYSKDAIYVGAVLYEESMDSIAATLFRKDGGAYSDWFYVSFDSYNDNRTGFTFAVNPRGVRKDFLIYDDTEDDIRWDAVWEAEAQILDDRWVVEMRIPLSQLRFDNSGIDKTWGINFSRDIARRDEEDFWSPTPEDASGYVSRFGTLEGMNLDEQPRRLEITPYASTDLTRAPGTNDNPYYNSNDFSGSVGADVKYGITSDLTLTATINPDFGQVEADPAVINLGAYEIYFREQRPFFLEGTDIFQFGNTTTFNSAGNPVVFYSRRIGRQPQANAQTAGIDVNHSDIPANTTIATAAKVSGKTKGGLSMGVLNAFTLKEKGNYFNDTGAENSFTAEPPTNYLVTRLKQDFNDGNTVVGVYGSSVNRLTEAEYLKERLHDNAFTTGADFQHGWNDREWIVSGTMSGTYVDGSRESILLTQTSPVRHYDRVDAGYLSVDSSKTSLSGIAGEFSISKIGGGNWRGSLTYSFTSPGYESNDMGFQNRSDYHFINSGLIYRENDPDWLRSYEYWAFQATGWNYGGDRINNFYNTGGNWQLENLWSLNVNVNFSGPSKLDRITRGGPIAARARDYSINTNLSSDRTKEISFNMGGAYRNDVSGEYEHIVWMGLTYRPTTNIQIEISPEFIDQKDTDQYVTTHEDVLAKNTFGHRYVFANIDQTTFSNSIRVDWTFSPDLSIQFYARPFITSGNFYDYKEFTTPGKFKFDVYGKDRGEIDFANGNYTVDPDRNGPAEPFSFEERDFNFRSVQSNLVIRWEYMPGSTLFLVWQQDRSDFAERNNFNAGRDFRNLLEAEPTNVFLVKASYWFGG